MLARLRVLLVKTPVLVTLGLVVCYLLFGYLAFPPLAKWGAEQFIAKKTGHALALAEARFDPLRLSLTLRGLELKEPDGKPLLGFDELFVDFEARSLFRWAYTLQDIRLVAPRARLELRPDGTLNWTAFLAAFKDEEEDKDDKLPRLLIDHIALQKGQVEFVDRKVAGGFETRLEPIDFELDDLSTLPDDKGAYTLSTRTHVGARIRWKGDLALNPILATGDLAIDEVQLARLWPYVAGKLRMAPPEGKAAVAVSYRVGYADKHLSLNLDRVGATLEGLRLQGKEDAQPAVVLDRFELAGGRVDLGQRSVTVDSISLNGGRVDLLRRADGRLEIQDWFAAPAQAPAPPAAPEPGKPAGPEAAWQLSLGRFALGGLALRYSDAGFVRPLSAQVGELKAGFKAAARVGAGAPEARLEDVAVSIAGIELNSVGAKDPLFSLAEIALEGGQVDLGKQEARLARVSFAGGLLPIQRTGNGDITLLKALERRAQPAAQAKPAAEPGGPAWRYAVDEVALAGWKLAVRDEGVHPAAVVDVVDLQASVKGVSQDLKAALPISAGFRVKSGGRFAATGKVVPAAPSADLRLDLTGLSLQPAQPYVGQAANLALVSGLVSSSGRLRYGKNLRYEGGFSVDNLLLNESETGNRFLAWKKLASDDLSAGLDSLDIGTLRLDGLGAKLIINADKTTNLKQILKTSPTAPPPAGTPPAPVATAKPDKLARDFRVGIDSIKVQEGELDFADLSLSLPFGTRIHELKGFINAISSKAGGAPAQLELDGLVDDYGLARAAGQVNLFDPTGYMDIKTVFRNVEMTRLTPYSATFAGRKIASGKLSLDLEYKIQQRQLQGENQIIMDKLTLGERVESPTAKNLPLDLAIAILSDADGKIDLGLPVSGSLDDPEFSYGRIIWKAIVNVITKIVTAPFRALGNLLGISGDKLQDLAFDPGSARLLPPEREKLKQLAQALEKRPKLALSVTGTYDPLVDRARIKETRLRLAVAKRMGAKLAEGEEPAPISTANPKAQQAIEDHYGERLGKEALRTLKARYYEANPGKQETMGKMLSKLTGVFQGKLAPASAEELAALKGADLHEVMYRRLLDKEAVGDEVLVALARQRAEAVLHELASANKVAPDRLGQGSPEPVEGSGQAVSVKLALGVARKTAEAGASAAPTQVPSPAQ